jgi:putative transposase
MPGTARAVQLRAKRESWKSRPRKARGGGREYHISALPEATRNALIQRHAANHAEQLTEAAAQPLVEIEESRPLAGWQRSIRDYRLIVLDLVDELTPALGVTNAVQQVAAMARTGTLPASVADALRAANARQGKLRHVHATTLRRWLTERASGGQKLAPKAPPMSAPPKWMPQLLALYQQPNKPAIAWCLRTWGDHYPESAAPNLRTAQRHIATMPVELREFGRMGKNAIRAVQPFVRRTMDGLWPMDVVTVDGHLFKAYVRHPFTGRKFRPELTAYLDIATRKALGFSAWLAESQLAIWGAFREMALNPEHGIPAIHYSDNGAYRGEQHRALCARVGTTVMFSEAYRAQARGVIERFNSSVWVPLAKSMPVYVGEDVDRESVKKALQKADKDGSNLLGWEDFIGACRKDLNDYNDRLHSTLKRKSPNQAWEKAVAEGWRPTVLDGDDLHDILPSHPRKVRRGEVMLPWGRYFSAELSDWHSRDVRVHYQPQDGSVVWVADERGTLICTAERGANERPYFHRTQMDHARAQREQGRVNRLERKLEAVREEGAAQIEHQPAAVDPVLQAQTEQLFAQQEQREHVHQLIDDPRQVHAYWLRMAERIESGDQAVTFEERRGCDIYRASDSHRSQQKFFEEFGFSAADFAD